MQDAELDLYVAPDEIQYLYEHISDHTKSFYLKRFICSVDKNDNQENLVASHQSRYKIKTYVSKEGSTSAGIDKYPNVYFSGFKREIGERLKSETEILTDNRIYFRT